MNTKTRYNNIQTIFKQACIGSSGCYLLSLCSIAEEVTNKPADIIGLLGDGYSHGYITQDCWIEDPCKVLAYLTGCKWTLRVEEIIPPVVKDEEYTILKYKWKDTHFKRRSFDTVMSSHTAKYGKLVSVYIFTLIS